MTSKNKKVRAMTITYIVDGGLYINITNKCSNACDFCIRNNADGAYGSNSLWLEREPETDEILASVLSHNLSDFSEIVFCGYGEPSYRLHTAREVALEIKRRYPEAKIRMNTNGQSDLILGMDTAPLFKDAFDSVSISLNAASGDDYQKICHSKFGAQSFDKIIEFAKNVNKYVKNVRFSIVKEALSEADIEKCKEISSYCGVELRIRDLIT